MSYLVTRLVRAAQLPRLPVHRAAVKAVLLALADDCFDDGSNAYTSVATMAREAALSARTVYATLIALREAGLIAEQFPPTQHRPRTWQLSLRAIAALITPEAAAKLRESDRDLLATLAPTTPFLPFESDLQVSHPDLQISQSDLQGLQPNGIERYENEESTAAQTPRTLALEPNGDNFHVIKALAIDVLHATGHRDSALVEAVKQRCADLQVDYGRHAAVPFNVVHRACAWAELQVVKAKHAVVRDVHHGRRRAHRAQLAK